MPNAVRVDNPDQSIRFFDLLPIQLTVAYVPDACSSPGFVVGIPMHSFNNRNSNTLDRYVQTRASHHPL